MEVEEEMVVAQIKAVCLRVPHDQGLTLLV